MKIKRFHENIENNISPERCSDIIDELKVIISELDENLNYIKSLENELVNYQSKSTKGNDQIDDSILNIQLIKKELETSVNNVDTTINNLVDYIQNGKKFLYTE